MTRCIFRALAAAEHIVWVAPFRVGGRLTHEAQDDQGNRCWVKQVPADDDAAIARLRYEAIVLAKLDHPGVVRLLDRGRNRSCFFLVLSPAPGRALIELLEGRPLALSFALTVADQLATLLHYLHAQGIICRILTPSAIYADHLGRIAYVDLSMVWDEVSPPDSTEMYGDPKYSSPEQISGAVVQRRSDMYSYGACCSNCSPDGRRFRGAIMVIWHYSIC